MSLFSILAGIYLAGSLCLLTLMWWMGRRHRRLYAAHFDPAIPVDQLAPGDREKWARMHQERFDQGFWRAVTVAWMAYHYPGFVISVLLCGGKVRLLPLVFGAAAVWLTLLYGVCRLVGKA